MAIWWWPAILIVLVTAAAALIKGRLATGRLADLIESTVDLYGRELAAQLGEPKPDAVSPAMGRQLTSRMGKSRWDPHSPLAD